MIPQYVAINVKSAALNRVIPHYGAKIQCFMDVQRCNVAMEVQRWNRNIMELLHNYDPNNYGVYFPGNA